MTEIDASDNEEELTAEVITLEGGTIEAVEGDVVHINQGGARSIVAAAGTVC